MKDHIRGTFVGAPGDVFVAPQVYQDALQTFLQIPSVASLSFSPFVEEVDSHGVGKVENHQVVELLWPAPNDSLDPGHVRDMCVYASDPSFFNLMDRYPFPRGGLTKVFQSALTHEETISAHVSSLPWIHLGYPGDLNKHIVTMRPNTVWDNGTAA